MTRLCLFRAAVALALILPVPLAAQEVVQPLPGTTDADRLGEEMRRVGANPRDVDALLTAGELSLKLGDLSGAASLFARAEKIEPRSGRLKAGMAAILVRSERPGEALRYFAQAESLGYDPRRFAADRAFAFDLIGEQGRAQRDYRTALADLPGDGETIRRYALSLGISGRQAEALAALDPLLRRNDRGAWRARAFVLAMGGDVADAARIAQTMMPPGMASGLQPFFERLPALPAIDRAFAVHFGEVRATPERIADARLVPPLAPFVPDAPPPVVLAAVQPAESARDRRRLERRSAPRVEVAAATPIAPSIPAPVPGYRSAPPSYRPPAAGPAPERIAAVPAARGPILVNGVRAGSTAQPVPRPAGVLSETPAPARGEGVALASLAQPQPQPHASPSPVAGDAAPPASALPIARASTPASPPGEVVQAVAAPPSGAASARGTPAPGFSSLAAADTVPAPAPPVPEIPRRAAPARLAGRSGEDSILARIVAGLSIPASELGVVAPERHVAPPKPTAVAGAAERVVAVADAKEARDAAARRLVADASPKGRSARGAADASAPTRTQDRGAARKLAASDRQPETDEAVVPPLTRAEKRAAARKLAAAREPMARESDAPPLTAAQKKAAARKTADKTAAEPKPADKKAAAKKALADRAAEDRKAERGNPERIWVQVSGGANESDLPKAWAGIKAKAAGTLGKRQAYTTPLRATNRVLTGPFKTDAEARAFVNQLAKAGVAAFTFTSDAGQSVKRLPAK